jgi:hypothetical protein
MPVTIAVNSIIDWMEGSNIINQERVLWINHEQSFAVVLDLLDSKSRPKRRNLQDIYMAIQEKQAIKHPCDPYLKSFIDFRKKHMEKAEKVWNFIGEIVECEPDIYDSKRKFTMVKDCAEKNQISQSAIYKYIRMYWQGGKTKLALLPEFSNCGAPNKPKPDTTIKRGRPTKHKIGVGEQNTAEVADSINVTEEMKGIFQAAITLYYYRDKNATPAQVFNKMNATFFSSGTYIKDGIEIPQLIDQKLRPSKRQFYYWFDKLKDPVTATVRREGKLAYAIKYREHKGNANQITMGPGFLYQVDWTMADIYLVNKTTRTQVMQRPIVYICVDVMSRMIAGIWVTLEKASWMTAAIVLENVVEDKVEYCKRYGITISHDEWPCNFLPRGFLGDRGEFYCKNSDNIVASLGSKVDNTSPYRADSKSIVEQMFRKFNLKAIHLLPGMVPREKVRWEPDHRLNAKLDIDQFTKLMIKAALYYNLYHEIENYPFDKFMLSTHAKPIPIELWNWGIAFRGGHFLDVDPLMVKQSLYPRGLAKITRRGIVFKNRLIYTCENEEIRKKILHASISGVAEEEVVFDPRSTNYIWIVRRREPPILCILVKDSSYANITMEDFESLKDEQDEGRYERKKSQEQALTELYATEEAVAKEAIRRTNEALASQGLKHPQIKNMKENTSNEAERARSKYVTRDVIPNTIVMESSQKEADDKDNIPLTHEERFLSLLKGGK